MARDGPERAAFARMTAPRRVVPGRFLFVTRSCTQRQFLLRPDKTTNNTFMYCLAEAAQRFDVVIVLSQMMSNHHHTVLYDPHGNEVEFREHFHKMLAKAQNAHRGRWENVWSSEEPSVVELMDREALLDKLVYTATNPVKDGLVDRFQNWPGPKLVSALLNQRPIVVRRPRHFFRKRGSMPLEVELVMKLPAHFERPEEFLEDLRQRISAEEEARARERKGNNRTVLGRQAILRQSWRDIPTSDRPRRRLRPRFATRNIELRIMTIERNKAWDAAYRAARTDLLDGKCVEFPYGTYWLRRFAGVRVEPPSMLT
jgi:putative transposase